MLLLVLDLILSKLTMHRFALHLSGNRLAYNLSLTVGCGERLLGHVLGSTLVRLCLCTRHNNLVGPRARHLCYGLILTISTVDHLHEAILSDLSLGLLKLR